MAYETAKNTYKSKVYKYEHECRFVLTESDINKDKICFECQDRNNSSARIRHYYEHEDFHLEKLIQSGSSITFGPSVPVLYHDNVRYCIETLTKRVKGFSPEIKFSKISYRKS